MMPVLHTIVQAAGTALIATVLVIAIGEQAYHRAEQLC